MWEADTSWILVLSRKQKLRKIIRRFYVHSNHLESLLKYGFQGQLHEGYMILTQG